MSPAMEKIKQAWEEQPLAVIGICAATFTAASKIIDSISSIVGRRAYAKQVRYRTNKQKP